ncbi:hypothetical protein B0H14DRAFT_3686466 [Mycena olivaceomarginata]|nr:hypothetical protein B0H14DRAFT_3686466 [Mycena olivaceomarginata]
MCQGIPPRTGIRACGDTYDDSSMTAAAVRRVDTLAGEIMKLAAPVVELHCASPSDEVLGHQTTLSPFLGRLNRLRSDAQRAANLFEPRIHRCEDDAPFAAWFTETHPWTAKACYPQQTNQHQYQSFSELRVGTSAGAMRSTSLDSVTTLVDAMPADKSKMTMARPFRYVFGVGVGEPRSGGAGYQTRHAEGQDAEKERALTLIEWFHFLIDQTIRRYALLEESLSESESGNGSRGDMASTM